MNFLLFFPIKSNYHEGIKKLINEIWKLLYDWCKLLEITTRLILYNVLTNLLAVNVLKFCEQLKEFIAKHIQTSVRFRQIWNYENLNCVLPWDWNIIFPFACFTRVKSASTEVEFLLNCFHFQFPSDSCNCLSNLSNLLCLVLRRMFYFYFSYASKFDCQTSL